MAKILGVNHKEIKKVYDPAHGKGLVLDYTKDALGGFCFLVRFSGVDFYGDKYTNEISYNKNGIAWGCSFPTLQVLELK